MRSIKWWMWAATAVVLQAACAGAQAADLPGGGPAERAAAPGATTLNAPPAECPEGWRWLWDGTTSKGWRSVSGPDFPAKGWEMKDGVLTVLGEKGGDIITVEKYRNFEFRFEFRLTPGANSGIKYFINPDENRKHGASVGSEYQVLDDDKHPDAKLGKPGTRTVGALYDLIAPAADKKPKPTGEWNEGRIVVNGPQVEHWLNGRKVVEYERGSDAFKACVAASKFKNVPTFGTFDSGHILIQDHNDKVSFRNLMIKVLP